MKQGKIKYINFERNYGFIETDQGEQVHFRFEAVQKSTRWESLHVGLSVEVEAIQGDRGLSARKVYAGERPQENSSNWPPEHGYRFMNPYNFVRFLDLKNSGRDTESMKLLGKCAPPTHDRWSNLSGRIECLVTVKTPLFISSGQPDAKDWHHPIFSFVKKNDEKYIPASSLRGPVRSVFEAVTNSCFSSFSGEKRLSYRLDPKLAGFLVPARLEKLNGQWQLRLLTGTAELSIQEKPRELYPASVRLYKPMRSSSRNPHAVPPPEVDLSPLKALLELGETYHQPARFHREVCFAVLMRLKFPPSWRVVAVSTNKEEAEQWIAKNKNAFDARADLRVANGVLCITNQNIDNKASERFFFQSGKARIIKLPGENKNAPPQVLQNYQDLLEDYHERHAKDVKERRELHPNQPLHKPLLRDTVESRFIGDAGFSRFILEDPGGNRWEEKRNGEVVYAYLDNDPDKGLYPRFLAPVSIPRVTYDHTIGDLLPKGLHRCESADRLCPACRTFGWVRATRGGAAQAYRGRVRFTDAKHTLRKPYPRPLTLAILGSPKPTTTRFYLTGPDGQPRAGRSDHLVGYDGNGGNNRLRGRKFYRHHLPDPRFSEAQLDSKGKTKSNQNRTITDAEDEGAQFTFTVHFENLAAEELGALLWSLELGERGYHRLGFGKPLGLGSVEIQARKVEQMDPQERYRSLEPNAGWKDVTASKAGWVKAFQEAMARRYSPPGEVERAAKTQNPNWEELFLALPNLMDLLAILGKQEPSLPVHYPRSSALTQETKGSFEWFVGNKRREQLELSLPTQDRGLPLINKKGEVW